MCESHPNNQWDSRRQNDPTSHLDRALPGTDRGSSQQVAAVRELVIRFAFVTGAHLDVVGFC